MESATPIIGLLWRALRGDVWGGGAEEWGGSFVVRVPSPEGGVDLTCSVRDWQVERVVI